jgi:Sulfotransferase family
VTATDTTERLPDFLIIGAPKAGTSALHAALTQHAQLRLSMPKEPKYFMCGDAPPPFYVGPGDAHSRREWIWRRDEYAGLFANLPDDVLCGESTPFYLFDKQAHRRIAEAVPDVKLIAVLRDPVDRAYSNWMHLWVDGLEPVSDMLAACDLERQRVNAGWAPFWRYIELGKYGEQLEHLRRFFDPAQIMTVRYRDLVDDPEKTVDGVCRFLGIAEGTVHSIPRDNTRPFVADSPRTRQFGRLLRAGAWVGAAFPPHVWRKVSQPVLDRLHRASLEYRPHLTQEERGRLVDYFRADIELLEELTGHTYGDWLSDVGAGGYADRVARRYAQQTAAERLEAEPEATSAPTDELDGEGPVAVEEQTRIGA